MTDTVSPIQHMMRQRATRGLHEYGRHCCEPECITILCIWNPGPRCYMHEAERLEAEREKRKALRMVPDDRRVEQEEREMEELLRTPPIHGLASAA